jgi:biotin carboxylase
LFKTYAMNKEAIILLKADEFLRDRAIVAALRNFNGMVVGMSETSVSTPNRMFDYVIKADPHDPSSALSGVQKFVMDYNINLKAVIPITEMTLLTGRKIADHYDLPYLAADVVESVRDKSRMKKAFYEADVATPRHWLVDNLEDLKQISNQLTFPIVIKPVSAAHSIGIRLIENVDEVEDAYNFCIDSLSDIAEEWGIHRLTIQVEEFIDSDHEISVEVINNGNDREIIAVTDKSLTKLPFFAETGHMVPSTQTNNQKIRNLALQACEALKLDRGVSHVEIRIDKKGDPFVIEVAARPGGDGIMDLVERSYGVNLYELHIKSYLGTLNEISTFNRSAYGTAAIAFFPQKKGKVVRINALKEIPDEVVSYYLTAKEGTVISDSLKYDDRLGTIEFFWENQIDHLSGKHLEMAQKIRDEIYEIC